MAWQMPGAAGQWTPAMGIPQDMSMAAGYTAEQWAALQQQNWQQWTQWQQQYSQWQTQYGEKYAQQLQAGQAMAGIPPLPVGGAAPAPPPPDQPPPPPPPHENNQPLYGAKQTPAGSASRNTSNFSNAKPAPGNNQWSYGTDAPKEQPSAVNKEALNKLAEEEKSFDIQFQKWEEEIERWRKENVNHPDKATYKEYEERFELCRAQLLERRKQMQLKRTRLLSNITPAANTAPGNTPIPPPPSNNSQNYNQNIQSQNKNDTYQQDSYNQSRNKNKNIDPQDRYECYDNMESGNLPPNPYPSAKSDPATFLQTTSAGKSIPGLDLVPETSQAKKNHEVIDISDEPSETQQPPDYSTISKGINNILGDAKIMNILSMVKVQGLPQVNSNQNAPVNAPTTTNNLNYPPNLGNRNQGNFDQNQQFGNRQNMPYNRQGPNFPMQQNQGMNSQYQQQGMYDDGQDMQQDQYDDGNMSYGGTNNRGGPDIRHGGPGRPDGFDIRQGGNMRGGSNMGPGGPDMARGGPGMQQGRQGGPDMWQGGPDMRQGGPDFRQGGPNMRQSGPDMRHGPGGSNMGGPNMGPGGSNMGGPGGPNMGGPNMGPGRLNMGGPNMGHGPMGLGGNSNNQGGPNMGQRGPNMGQGGPNMGQGGPNMGQGGPNIGQGGPNIGQGGPNMGQGRPNMGQGGPNMRQGGLNMRQGGPDMNQSNPNIQPNLLADMRRPGPNNQGNNGSVPPLMGFNRQPLLDMGGQQNVDNYYGQDRPMGGNEAPMSQNNRHKWVEEPLFAPSIVVEYDHKPLRLQGRDFIEPVHTFDYNHRSKDGDNINKKKDFEKEVDELFTRMPRRDDSDKYSKDLFYRDYERRGLRDDVRDTRDLREDYRREDVRDDFRARAPRDLPRDLPREDFERRRVDDRYNDDRRRDDSRDFRRRDERRDDRRDDRDRFHRREDIRDRERDREPYRSRDDSRLRDERSRDDSRLRDDRSRDYKDRRDDRRDDPKHRSKSREADSRKRGPSKENDASASAPSKKAKENKANDSNSHVVMIDDILEHPGRDMRPEKIVIILRGLPGSGKSYLAKLIRDREAELGGTARIMSIDDYFMQEGETQETDPQTGKVVKKPYLKYEYDESAEEAYMTSLKRAFKRSLTDGYFNFLIYDAMNEQLKSYADVWNYARQCGFQVYICTLEVDVQTCFKRNIHNRTLEDIQVLKARFFGTPTHHIQLDPTTLLQSASIQEVHMEDAEDDVIMEDVQEVEVESVFTSKWEKMDDANQLARLDGTSKPLRPSQLSMEEYLQLDDWKPNVAKPGKKTVRWADIEERREQEKLRAIGFVVGQTDWNRMNDPTMGSGALTQTKFIERVRRH